jgi:hypothetical protein
MPPIAPLEPRSYWRRFRTAQDDADRDHGDNDYKGRDDAANDHDGRLVCAAGL